MDLLPTLLLLGIVALAAYVQTVTGFAFGLIVMGSAVLLNLAPVAMVAILISILSLFNCCLALYRNLGHFDREMVLLCSLSGAVTLILGVWALNVLSEHYVHWLQIILGVAIVTSSLLLIFRPRPQTRRSGKPSFLVFGGIAGLMSGLFSTSGPPLVFHFYRQPIAQRVIRDSLLMIFAITSVQRLVVVTWLGDLTVDVLVVALTAIPAVLGFTWLGRRFPPPVSDTALRRIAFTLLLLSGTSLCLSALL
ncbi:MAG: sulfite exporter TauE/SafE family protein [Natronospirillum sp.]|uniref:sulfite exporter TauE/SafE family protein n=1 Tax=Natronospirillum sp. TaxID=2812955 RepID=UPI0025DE9C8C|nr:sulfite exporter TauE/SafE family protein [Natronospirillum sp.]MCH8553045.1 sulfite exporter TauE/SafE family protein [Natronospirillum sp.]